MPMSLRYLFIDMNAYFASVEQQFRPELRNRPVAVVPVLADTTSCIAASYEAKRFGVKTGTKVYHARRLCPDLHIVQARPRLYIRVHHELCAVIGSCLPVLAVRSIDEMVCRLDAANQKRERVIELAAEIKTAIRTQLGEFLRCSIGVASNELLAKMAADIEKPDGLTMIPREELPDRLYPLEVTDFPGIGTRMGLRFYAAGVTTVRHLLALTQREMSQIWQSRWLGELWWRRLRGDDLPEQPTRRRTLGHSNVLRPAWRTEDRARTMLMRLTEKAAARLRHLGYWTESVTVSIRYLNRTWWRMRRRLERCQDTITLIQTVAKIWARKPKGMAMSVSVSFDRLIHQRNITPSLFEYDHQLDAVSRVVDEINQTFGMHTIFHGAMMGMQHVELTRIAFTQIPDLNLSVEGNRTEAEKGSSTS